MVTLLLGDSQPGLTPALPAAGNLGCSSAMYLMMKSSSLSPGLPAQAVKAQLSLRPLIPESS